MSRHIPTSGLLTVSAVARQFNISPRVLSDLFYQRRLDDARCPVVSGRRIIPADYVPAIERRLVELGILKVVAKWRATPSE